MSDTAGAAAVPTCQASTIEVTAGQSMRVRLGENLFQPGGMVAEVVIHLNDVPTVLLHHAAQKKKGRSFRLRTFRNPSSSYALR